MNRYPLSFTIKPSAVRKDGTCIVFLLYCYNSKQKPLVDTGVAIPPKYWNAASKTISSTLPASYGVHAELQETLFRKKRRAEDLIDEAKKRGINPAKFVKDNLSLPESWELRQLREERGELSVYYQIMLYAQSREHEVSEATINIIRMVKTHLLAFETYRGTPISFESFDYKFYCDFVSFLKFHYVKLRRKKEEKGLRINSIGKTIKWLKHVLVNRMAMGIYPQIDLSLYLGMEEDTDAIYLSWQEIHAIYALDLSGEPYKVQVIRDEFILGCLTGFRFSDYSEVAPEEIRGGFLYVKTKKTTERVVVPLKPEAHAILMKYKMQMPPINNVDFNLYIKYIGELAGIKENIKFSYRRGNQMIEEIRPKFAWITSHTCRRSFCTNEFLDTTPIILIMAISGHKTEKAFRRYIKADNLEKAKMIEKIWKDRPGLSAYRA